MNRIENMNESRVKRIVELMIKNDAPMANLHPPLKFIREGVDISGFPLINREFLVVRDIYDSINLQDLDEDMGLIIIRENKPLIAEYYALIEPIWKRYMRKGFRKQEVPKRVEEILDFVISPSRLEEYERPLGQRIYRFAMREDYVDTLAPSRALWFIEGKPVRFNPEKLPRVVDFAQRLVLNSTN